MHRATKIILAGDHLQLGPVVLSQEVEKCGLGVSLFEVLLKRKIPKAFLQIQYRMAPEIAEFISNTFYQGKLENGVSNQRQLKIDLFPFEKKPFIFINVYGMEQHMHTSFFNSEEANCVMSLLKQLIHGNVVQGKNIGVISCYEGQKRCIIDLICLETEENIKKQLADVEIENIDGFQGREKDIIIFSTVRSNDEQTIGFMNNRQCINVALSRAKFKCFIIGNIHTLHGDRTWKTCIEHVIKRECLFDACKNKATEIVFKLRPCL